MQEASRIAVKKLFQRLLGTWHIQRLLGQVGIMEGVAHFRAWSPEVWHYQERGIADWKAQKKISVYREYAYLCQEDTIAVHFWDPKLQQPAKLLHTLSFGEEVTSRGVRVAHGMHQCGEDTYKACYRFFTQDHFELTYQVEGPRKDYKLQTVFRRA